MENNTKSLSSIVLNENQKAWLKKAIVAGDQIDESDIARDLGDNFPAKFSPYKDLGHFWEYGRITLFGRYKINPNDEFVLVVDKIMTVLRDEFIKIKSKKYASMSELALATGQDPKLIKRAFDIGYLRDFWPLDSDSGKIEYNSELKENVFSFPGINEYQKIRQYINLENQLETRWQNRHKPYQAPLEGWFGEEVVSTKLQNTEEIITRTENPTVFISYSHDSKDHKQWIIKLAEQIIKDGIDVILDAWDLKYGDDVGRFMQRSVKDADYVLAICTEAYVRKADEGKGGAGYEATIITGELVKDQGTAKFIPVIRQKSDDPIVPDFLPTRMYANLSAAGNFEDEYKKLIRSLYNLPPNPKPSLGKNPFLPAVAEPIALAIKEAMPEVIESIGDLEVSSASTLYEKARLLIRSNDGVEWRKLVLREKNKAFKDSLTWSKAHLHGLSSQEHDEGLKIFEPLFAVILAGIESGHEKYSKQTGLIDELLFPHGWPQAGLVMTVELPKTVVFVYQAIYGALCASIGQFDNLAHLAESSPGDPYSVVEPIPLLLRHELCGWPQTLEGNSIKGWDFLVKLPSIFPILYELFSTDEEWQKALAAYYTSLSILEFSLVLKEGKGERIKAGQMRIDVPSNFLFSDFMMFSLVISHLKNNKIELKKMLIDRLGTIDKVVEYWPSWVDLIYKFAEQMTDHSRIFGLRRSNLDKLFSSFNNSF
jgi:hypothetical protein